MPKLTSPYYTGNDVLVLIGIEPKCDHPTTEQWKQARKKLEKYVREYGLRIYQPEKDFLYYRDEVDAMVEKLHERNAA